MTKSEKIIFLSLIFFLAIGIEVRIFNKQYSKITLQVAENQNLIHKKKNSSSSVKNRIVAKNGKLCGVVDINEGTVEDFASLPFVGKKMAERIIQYRTANGPFKEKTELLKIKEIGVPFYNKIEPYIVVQTDQ